MGLAKHGRLIFGIGLISLLAVPATFSCNSSKSNNVSSKSFLAPQLIAVNPNTGQNAQGQKAIELLVNKVDILREVHRRADGTPGKLDSELRTAPCRVTPMGKIDDRRLLILESESKTILTIDLFSNTVQKQMDRDAFIAVFNGQTQKPVIGTVLPLKNGWLLCYETSTKSIFAARADPAAPLVGGVIIVLIMDQTEIQRQLFPSGAKVQVTVKSFYEFLPNQILMVPANANLTAANQITLEDNVTTIAGHFVFPDGGPFLEYSKITTQSGNVDSDVKDFQPIGIPGTNRFLMFDRARDTSSFIEVQFITGADEVIRTVVYITANRDALLTALQNANQGGDTFSGQFRMTSSFYNPDALKDPIDPTMVPLIYALDDETNNIFSYNFREPTRSPEKIRVMSSSTQITARIDLNYDPAQDSGTFDPQLRFAPDTVTDNKLAFDLGPSQLLSFNYETGQVVVVFHKRDITKETSIFTVQSFAEINFIQTLDPPPDGAGQTLRVFDAVSSSLLAVRLEYISIPLSVHRK